ncbi:hypothetical protein [Scytonema sp. PRP1]|uniref:hypothetical protein n=1 Tax=Scytonema sp. PRP1 TaxID=3120513 RepID=UPI002FD318D9
MKQTTDGHRWTQIKVHLCLFVVLSIHCTFLGDCKGKQWAKAQSPLGHCALRNRVIHILVQQRQNMSDYA